MIERRFVKGTEIRATTNGHIEGHAAVFNEEYVLCDYSDFRIVETIRPGAFSRAVSEKQDVRALFNHEPSNLLGRTSANTLTLQENSRGLYFDCNPPDTQMGRDVRTLIQRGDISGCSFGFEVTKQTRTEEEDNGKITVRRAIEDVDLYDVSPVTYPAYQGTDVKARALELRAIFPDGVPQKLRAHILSRITDTPNDPGDGERRATDPDNDGDDDDAELVKLLKDSATACESFAKSARSAVNKFDNDILANMVKEGTAAMALIDDCIEETNKEISGESNSANLTLELAKARTRMAEMSLTQ